MKLQQPKGTRDFSPEEKIVRQELTKKFIKTFELFGFSPLETPLIERMDVLAAKYAGETADVMKEVFKIEDQGGRKLGLRFDLTVPLARYIGMNPETKMPFKRYQIGKVYRDGPIKQGRYREFWQYDIDIIGSKNMQADAEIINIVLKMFTQLDIAIEIRINNRKLLTGILEEAGIPKEKTEETIITIDKFDKIGAKGVEKELEEKNIIKEKIKRILSNLNKTIQEYEELLPENEGIKELKELFGILPEDKRIRFIPSLARGLAYYTGTVFEVFSKAKDLNFSLAGGGRYDEMIGNYLGGKQVIPAVGLAFGFEPILEVMKKQNKIILKKTKTQIYIIPIGKVQINTIVNELREQGINTDFAMNTKGISKNIRYADAYDIPYVLFVGENEIKEGKYKLKNLKTGKEEMISIENLKTIVEFK